MNKKIIRALATGLLVLTSMGVAFGAGTQFEIKATMDSGVKVIYKDKAQKLVDENGEVKDPIMYNGTVYVPIRSVANIFGINIDWDNENRNVLLKDNVTLSVENDSLETVMGAVYSRFSDKPMMTVNAVVTDENVENYLGLQSLNGAEALASESMIGAIAHSVVLLRATEGTDIEALKKEIKEKVDPRKWICVGVEREEIIVDNIGNLIIMIIDGNNSTKLHEGFLNLK